MASMGKLQQLVMPFTNKGLVQRVDPGMLQPGQYYNFLNMMSTQEGAVNSRLGGPNASCSVSPALTTGGTTSLLHSMAKMRLSAVDTSNPRYWGHGGKIYRAYPDSAGFFQGITNAAIDAAGADYLTSDQRWQAAEYNPGQQAQPNIFFATPSHMMRDGQVNSALPVALQQWGVKRPNVPVVAVSGYGGTNAASNTIKSFWSPATASDTYPATRMRVISSGINFLYTYTGFTGYYQVSYSTSIFAGPSTTYPNEDLFVRTASGGVYLVSLGGNVSGATFDLWWPFGSTVTAGTTFFHEMRDPVTSSSGIAQDTIPYANMDTHDFSYSDPVFPASAQSTAANGYTTEDFVHISLWFNGPENISDVRVRFFVGPGNTDYTNDFYEKSIVVNQAASTVQGATTVSSGTALTASQSLAAAINSGAFGGQDPTAGLFGPGILGTDVTSKISDQLATVILAGLSPQQLGIAQAGLGTIGAYFDASWRKSEMLAVGRAGQIGYNWQNITNGVVIARALSSTSTVIMRVGPCWTRGGYGLDTTVPGAFPYDYLMAFRNPLTNHIGNPSVPMIEENFITVARRSGVGLYIFGLAPTLAGGPQLNYYTGSGSLVLYRRGGAFSDGLYRLVKSIPNPGAAFTFVADLVPDYQIVAAQTLEFDNDQPVTSTLPTAFSATIASAAFSTISAGVLNTVTLAVQAGNINSLRTRSIMHLGVGAKAEDTVIENFSSTGATTGTLTFYAQRTQAAVGLQITVEAVAGQPCDLVCQAHDAVYLAGDTANPHILYRSKTGRPEAWPVINDVTKQSHQIPVGTPSNLINGVVEFNGDIICLNISAIYVVRVWQGVMQAPVEAPVQRGCFVKKAFCKGINSIYYVSSDGVYEWAGGASRKISEEIDWVFRDRNVNGISPMSRVAEDLARMVVFFHQNMLFISLKTVSDGWITLRYDTLFNRWSQDQLYNDAGLDLPYTSAYAEQDTNRLYAARDGNGNGAAIGVLSLWNEGTVGSTDGYSLSPGLDGVPIYSQIVTPFFTAGAPAVQKLFTDIVIEYASPSTDLNVEVMYDFRVTSLFSGSPDKFVITGDYGVGTIAAAGNTVTRTSGVNWGDDLVGAQIAVGYSGSSTFTTAIITGVNSPGTITAAQASWLFSNTSATTYLLRRNRAVFSLGLSTLSATTVANGRVAYAIALRIIPQSALHDIQVPMSLYSATVNYVPLESIQRGRITDWNDNGYPYDKQLDVLSIEYELPTGISTPVEMWLDVMQGITGNTTLNAGVAKFQLCGSSGSLGSNIRHKESINIQNVSGGAKIIAKQTRLRPVQQSLNILVYDWSIQHKQYPADTVNFTEPNDNGSPYDKYFTQMILEVDTGGVTATAAVRIDGTAYQTVTFSSTEEDRVRIFTLQQGLLGKVYNLVFTAGSGGKFQLFNHKMISEPADKGPVIHTHDWDDCGYPYDKHLYYVTFEYEVSADTTLSVLGLAGVQPGSGQTISTIASIPISNSSGTRRLVQYRFSDGSIYKMMRFQPVTGAPATTAKIYKPVYKYEEYPPDIVPFTEPSNYGSPFLKYFQQLLLDVDTGGNHASVVVQIDGTAAQTFSITTSPNARIVDLTMAGNQTGYMARILATPTATSAGKFQLFSHNFITVPADKGPVMHTFDWEDCGHPYDKHFYEMTVEFEVGGTTAQALIISGVTGTVGNQATVSIGAITLSGVGGRIKRQFSFPTAFATTVVKMIRVAPDPTQPIDRATRVYKPEYQFEKYPPDVVRFTEYKDFGGPYLKYFQQLLLDVDTGGAAATVVVEIDGSTVQTFSPVSTTADTRKVNLTMLGNISGKMARILATPSNSTGAKFQLFSSDFVTLPADKGPVMHSYDWDDLGHPYDKRMYHVTFEYEVTAPVIMSLQGVAGIDGGETVNSAIAFLTLSATGASRKKEQYQFPDGSIYKLIKFIPVTNYPGIDAKIYKPDWQFEKYPADIVPYTEPDSYGSPFLKYFQQMILDVDTGGVAATVICEIDGASVQTLSVTTTGLARNKTLTLDPVLVGRMGRILATPGTGGKFQLFSGTYITLPADKGPVMHSFDYDDLGWPYDKRLKEVTIEYDTAAVNTTVWMDTVIGPLGQQHVTHAQHFVLSGGARSLQTFPIEDGQIVKMVKLFPASTTTEFREWKYKFDFERMPADTVLFTEWSNLEYPCEKILRSVTIDADTGGVPATVEIQVDGSTRHTFTVNGNVMNRVTINTVPSNIIGKLFRLKFTPGANGKMQLFSHNFERILEPCYLTHWDSYEQSFGSNGYKFIKQIWLEYVCTGGVVFTVYRDDDEIFYQTTLPAHFHRDAARFYLPKEATWNGDVRYLKSKIYRFTIDAVSTAVPFKFYRDASRIETRNLSQDEREGFLQSYLFSNMPIPV